MMKDIGRSGADAPSGASPLRGPEPATPSPPSVTPPNAVRIAVVQSLDGHLTVCGPHDYGVEDHGDAMSAALCWHLEAGHLPAASYWVAAVLPPLPSVPELRASASRGEFPRSFLDTIIEEGDPVPELGPEEPPADFGSVR